MINPNQVLKDFVGVLGTVFIYSLDKAMVKMVQELCVSYNVPFKHYEDSDEFRFGLQIACSKGQQVLAIVEREINGISNISLIADINNYHVKDVKVVVVSYATTEAIMAEVLSLNVANVIIKFYKEPRVDEKVLLEKVVNALSPDNEFTTKLKEAKLALMDGDFATVEKICTTLLRAKESQAVLMVYAEMYERLEKHDLAEKLYLRAFEYSKPHIQLLDKMYRFYYSIDKWQQAMFYLKMLDGLSPSSSKRKQRLAHLSGLLNNKDDALMYAAQAEECSVQESLAEHQATVISIATSLLPVAPEKAREMLSSVLSDEKPDSIEDVELLETMARLLNRQRKHDEALVYYLRAYKVQPTAILCFNIGICYLQKGEHSKASSQMKTLLSEYANFVEEDPLKSPHLAYVFKCSNDVELMEKYKQIALETYPNHPLMVHLTDEKSP